MPSFARGVALASVICGAATGMSQTLSHVYNRDTGEDFKLKGVKVQTRLMGPIVRNRTVFTFENPYKKLTEASFNFSVDQDAVLSAFAYWYRTEYVPGILMDKNKAWYIYTAITSRDRDPGIMERVGSTDFHAQIYPLAKGYELRVELLSVGVVDGLAEGYAIPTPSREYENSVENPAYSRLFYAANHQPLLNITEPAEGRPVVSELAFANPADPQVFAQRYKDGQLYVVGVIRGKEGDAKPAINGLNEVYWLTQSQPNSWAFVGKMRKPGQLTFKSPQMNWTRNILGTEKGSDAAKLWANQRLNGEFKNRKEALNFSLRYGVPSALTALLAVPQEEMKLFRKKAAEYERQKREEERRNREWSKNRNQNWRDTGGGDPEIRVKFDDAKEVYAVLPDGRVIQLKQAGDGYWGGSYDIPADAPEGPYNLRVVAVKKDGSTEEQKVSYNVDRTSPNGEAKVETISGVKYLVVRSEPGLAQVKLVLSATQELKLEEVSPGVYRVELPSTLRGTEAKVVLIDKAHNLRELTCRLQQ